MKNIKEKNFVPIWQFAKTHDKQVQTVYRWIREGKIAKEDFRIIEKVVKRLEINENCIYAKKS